MGKQKKCWRVLSISDTLGQFKRNKKKVNIQWRSFFSIISLWYGLAMAQKLSMRASHVQL